MHTASVQDTNQVSLLEVSTTDESTDRFHITVLDKPVVDVGVARSALNRPDQ